MLIHNSYSYIQIGLAIRLLRNIDATNAINFALTTLSALRTEVEKANFEVTLALMNAPDYMRMEANINNIENREAQIGTPLAQNIWEEMTKLETVIYPESSIKKIYILPTRRYNSDYLLNQPDKLFANGTYEKLTEITKHDINSACRCLLFGESTAVAFHILRATEATLKQYYFHHKKQNRLNKPMWSNMLDQLKAKTRNKPSLTLLNSLDLIRTAYRNPTQHPEAIYEIDSAQDLFGVCLDVIGKMGKEV